MVELFAKHKPRSARRAAEEERMDRMASAVWKRLKGKPVREEGSAGLRSWWPSIVIDHMNRSGVVYVKPETIRRAQYEW